MAFLKRVLDEFIEDNCTTLAAALAYYMLFALPPLLYLLLTVVTFGMSIGYEQAEAEQKARQLIERHAGELIGNESAADEIATILERNQQQRGVWWKSLLSLAGVLIGATGVVGAVQASLNRVWSVQPDPETGGIKNFLVKRLLSFGMILGLGFLLLVSMVISTTLAAVGSEVGSWLGMESTAIAIINYLVIFAVTVVAFAAILKFMPDATIGWRDVWVGALATAVLFSLGRLAMAWHFSMSEPGAKLGSAAAALAVLLVWVYYSSLILLLGAEFTQVWANRFGRGIRPEEGAVRIETTLVRGSTATGNS